MSDLWVYILSFVVVGFMSGSIWVDDLEQGKGEVWIPIYDSDRRNCVNYE